MVDAVHGQENRGSLTALITTELTGVSRIRLESERSDYFWVTFEYF